MKYFFYPLILLLMLSGCEGRHHHYVDLNITKEGRAEILSYNAMLADINQTFDADPYLPLDYYVTQGKFFEQTDYNKTADAFIKVQFSFFYDPDLEKYYYLGGTHSLLREIQLILKCHNDNDTPLPFNLYYNVIDTTMFTTAYMSVAYLSSLGCIEKPYQLHDLSLQIQGEAQEYAMTDVDVFHYDSNVVILDAQEINEAFAVVNE